MSQESPDTPKSRGRSQRDNWLIVLCVLVVLAAALAIAARDVWTSSDPEPPPSASNQRTATDAGAPATVSKPAVVESNVIDDDGHSMWVSPTDGRPLDLAYLPPGVEIILVLRPAKLLAHPEGEKVLAAMGPWAEETLRSIVDTSGTSVQNFDRLTIGVQNVREDLNRAAIVLTSKTLIELTSETIVPDAGKGRVMLLGPTGFLLNWRELQAASPPLSRDLERLMSHTDANRTATLLARPQSLFADGGKVFDGQLTPLQAQLETIFEGDVSALCVSLNWGKDFFIELVAVPTLESSPRELSEKLATWIKQLPDEVEESIAELAVSPHSRRVVARLPEMMRRLAAYTRSGYDDDVAILRCYLPVAAGHNLLMAGELALAEGQGRPTTSIAPRATIAQPSRSITDRLEKKTTLRFAREELEAALGMLAQDVGVPITIRGRDLQLDGITRNQLFAIDLAGRPVEEILVEILRRANPDKTATGPADPRQKLVYVVGPDSIIITTRAAAAARGEELPSVFLPK